MRSVLYDDFQVRLEANTLRTAQACQFCAMNVTKYTKWEAEKVGVVGQE